VQERVLDRGKSGGRADDNEETVVKRIKTCASSGTGIMQPLARCTPSDVLSRTSPEGFDQACAVHAWGSADELLRNAQRSCRFKEQTVPVKQFYQRKGLCAIISAVPEVQEVFHNTTQVRDWMSRAGSRSAPPVYAAKRRRSPPSRQAQCPAAGAVETSAARDA